ncbi:MAG: hypothetical protein ACXWG1_14985 [Usitatibacter sp.]
MYANTPWHAEGLRWIGSLFTAAAEHIERAAIAATPCEPLPPEHRSDDEAIDAIRQRILARYF